MKDYYKILELKRDAGVKEIRKAYRNLALKLHPDVNSSNKAETEFIQLGEAYEILKNPIKKIQYDSLYDYKVLGKNPKTNNRYKRKSESWEESVVKRKKKGGNRARKNTKKVYNKFKKKTKKSAYFDWFWTILEIILNVITI